MLTVNIVVAASENNVIGKDNKLLWDLPNDTAFFKNVTYGMPVIMGRKTLESLGKPLKGRTNIVITRHPESIPPDAEVVKVASLDDALKAAADTDARQAWVIGGGEIYRQAFDRTDNIYLTRVLTTVSGDTFFPEIDEQIWKRTFVEPHDSDERHAHAYRFETWQRR